MKAGDSFQLADGIYGEVLHIDPRPGHPHPLLLRVGMSQISFKPDGASYLDVYSHLSFSQNQESPMLITEDRFSYALKFAHHLHQNQKRKHSNVPYISHLMAVSAMVLENGGDEDTAIAALLHDAIEDQGGEEARQLIHSVFGPRVSELVDSVTETDQDPKPPWAERKKAYLAHLKDASAETLLIAVADKLHNAKSTLRDFRMQGPEIWERFNAGKEEQCWFFARFLALVAASPNRPVALVSELFGVFHELFPVEALAKLAETNARLEGSSGVD